MSGNKIGDRLFTTKTGDIQYLVIPKCGCTFIKNVLWKIDNKLDYHTPNRIHDAKFFRVSDFGLTEKDILKGHYAFTVIRNPVDRFFSLYQDKVIGDGYKRYIPLRKTLVEKYNLLENPISISDHRRNCQIFIRWIGLNLKAGMDFKPESHWSPQSYRKGIMKSLHLKLLLVDELEEQLEFLLRPIMPSIGDLLKNVEKNRSKYNFSKQEIITKDIRQQINYIYKEDLNLFKHVKNTWLNINFENNNQEQIPTYPLNVDELKPVSLQDSLRLPREKGSAEAPPFSASFKTETICASE